MFNEKSTKEDSRINKAAVNHYNQETKTVDLTGTITYIMSDEDAKKVAEQINAEKLDVNKLIFTHTGLTDLSADFFQDSRIREFDFIYNDFTATGLKHLLEIPNIRWLDLRFNTMLSDKDITKVFAKENFSFPSTLLYLGLSGCATNPELLKEIDDKIRANNIEDLKAQLHISNNTDTSPIEDKIVIDVDDKPERYKKIFDDAIDRALKEISEQKLKLPYIDRIGLAREIIHEATQLTLSISSSLVKYEHKYEERSKPHTLSGFDYNPLNRSKNHPLNKVTARKILRTQLLKALEEIKQLNLPPSTFREKTHIVAHLLHKLIDLEPSNIITPNCNNPENTKKPYQAL